VDIGTFWGIIETARVSAALGRPVHWCLARHRAALTEQEILEYQERFDEVHGALYRWDVRAAAYLIGGGCSDDSFIDFRAGLIAQGRDWYDQAAVCPDSLAGHPAVTAAAGPAWDRPLFDEQVTTPRRMRSSSSPAMTMPFMTPGNHGSDLTAGW
jgi:hypothetical protein